MNDGHPVSQPYSRARLLAALTGAAVTFGALACTTLAATAEITAARVFARVGASTTAVDDGTENYTFFGRRNGTNDPYIVALSTNEGGTSTVSFGGRLNGGAVTRWGYFASGQLIVGTDPGGSEIARFGGNVRAGGSILVSGGASSLFYAGASGSDAPTFTSRSAGTKIVLFDTITGSLADAAIGIEPNYCWFSMPGPSTGWKWYAGTGVVATLTGAGGFSCTTMTTVGLIKSTVATAANGLNITDNSLSNFYVVPGYKSTSGSAVGVGGGEFLAFFTNGSANERGRINSDGTWVLGSDPGGSELLRIGGTTRISGNLLGSNIYGVAILAQAASPIVAIDRSASSNASQLLLRDSTNARYNWMFGVQYNVDNGWEITPSTAVGGSTYSTPSIRGSYDGSSVKLGFLGAAPIARPAAAAAATDAATTQTLANSLRTILINLGLAS